MRAGLTARHFFPANSRKGRAGQSLRKVFRERAGTCWMASGKSMPTAIRKRRGLFCLRVMAVRGRQHLYYFRPRYLVLLSNFRYQRELKS